MNKSIKIFAGLVIASAVVLAILSLWNDSIIVDEVPHIGAGYSYLVKQDMRLNPEHPPLAKDIAAIPLLFIAIKQTAFESRFWQEDVNGQWDFGRLLIFNSGNNADLIRHLVKLPLLIFFILSAVLIFKWGKKLYGDTGGITALILFAFSPTIIAHSRLVTTDMAALFGIFYATYFYIKFLKNKNKKNMIWASLTFGIALLLKFSTFLLVPFFSLFSLVYGFVEKPKDDQNWFRTKTNNSINTVLQTFVIFIIGLVFIVWPVYFFHTHNYPPLRQAADTRSILTSIYGDSYMRFSSVMELEIKAASNPVLRPLAEYALGFLRVLHQTSEPHDTYFLGNIDRYGNHLYFPIVYFLKETLAWWTLVIIALLAAVARLRYPLREWVNRSYHRMRNHTEESAMILWLIIYWSLSIKSTLNIGVRHLLPTFPFAILLVSGQISKVIESAKIKGKNVLMACSLILSVLLGWHVYENLKIFPYYLTYFNQVAGGPPGGYRYVVDSNLDWGQDLIRFSKWVDENNISKIEFDYFGWADPSYYLHEKYVWAYSTKFKDANDFKIRNQSDGWLAVSATFLMSSAGSDVMPNKINYLWLNSYQPVTVIGNSIFVYHIK